MFGRKRSGIVWNHSFLLSVSYHFLQVRACFQHHPLYFLIFAILNLRMSSLHNIPRPPLQLALFHTHWCNWNGHIDGTHKAWTQLAVADTLAHAPLYLSDWIVCLTFLYISLQTRMAIFGHRSNTKNNWNYFENGLQTLFIQLAADTFHCGYNRPPASFSRQCYE